MRILKLIIPLTALAPTLLAQGGTAVYELTHASTWSKQTHPKDFPSSPHYSPLIGATHNGSVRFWQRGGIASPGIESMAETGSTSLLRSEVQGAIRRGAARDIVSGGGLGTSPGTRKIRFTVHASHSKLTLVSMLAPSPDWFIGTDSFELMKNGQWIDRASVQLHLYDSGTDSGVSYTSPNKDTQPREKIDRITTLSGPFQNRPTLIGTYTLVRVAETLVYGCGVNPAGSMTTSGEALLGKSVQVSMTDPLRSISNSSVAVFLLATKAQANFPCGIKIPGLGLGKQGAVGELLIGNVLAPVVGGVWSGNPVRMTLSLPTDSRLIGARLFSQGVFVDGSRIALTNAMTLQAGR